MNKSKIRLDELLVKRNLANTLKQAVSLIMTGKVLVNDKKILKSGTPVSESDSIRVIEKNKKYVSRGGEKLEGFWLKHKFPIKDQIALDVGVSTGGFTDFLLKQGAKHVFGVDVSYGVLDEKIRSSPKVHVFERQNARNISEEDVKEKLKTSPELFEYFKDVSLVVMDVSFISVLKIIPNIIKLVQPETNFIILIKPQFEASKEQVSPGGIVKDSVVRQAVVDSVIKQLSHYLSLKFIAPSSLPGTKGNQEYLAWFS